MCQDYHLCDGIKAAIGGAVHGVQAIWDDKSITEDWGFLLVDAKKSVQQDQFNQNSVDSSTFTSICSLLPFGFYCHWSLLVLRDGYGVASFLHSREGVTEGGGLDIIVYGICILPLIKNLKN